MRYSPNPMQHSSNSRLAQKADTVQYRYCKRILRNFVKYICILLNLLPVPSAAAPQSEPTYSVPTPASSRVMAASAEASAAQLEKERKAAALFGGSSRSAAPRRGAPAHASPPRPARHVYLMLRNAHRTGIVARVSLCDLYSIAFII